MELAYLVTQLFSSLQERARRIKRHKTHNFTEELCHRFTWNSVSSMSVFFDNEVWGRAPLIWGSRLHSTVLRCREMSSLQSSAKSDRLLPCKTSNRRKMENKMIENGTFSYVRTAHVSWSLIETEPLQSIDFPHHLDRIVALELGQFSSRKIFGTHCFFEENRFRKKVWQLPQAMYV